MRSTNIGSLDRKIRFVLGVVILVVGLLSNSWFAVLGLIPLATGTIRFCPLYSIFGLDTKRKKTTS